MKFLKTYTISIFDFGNFNPKLIGCGLCFHLKKLKIKHLLFGVLVQCVFFSNAQDLHYSQYFNSPLNLNPANAGYFNGDYRVVLNNRNQWKSVTVPYKTFSASFDMKAIGIKSFYPNTGAGLMINNDKDGDSHLHTLNIACPLSFYKPLDDDTVNSIRLGIQFGYTQKRFDVNDLNFDNQFTGDLFDPNAPTGEPVSNYSMSYFDLGFGLAAQLFTSEDFQLNTGFAVQHINSPKNNFYPNGNVKIKPHYIFNADVFYPLTENMLLIPSLIYMNQNSTSELDINAQLKFDITQFKAPVTNLYAGAGARISDGIVLNAGADFKNIYAGFSYDINLSGLKKASNGRGAIEFSLIYKLKTVRALPPSPPCNIY